MTELTKITIKKPDDWHLHLRDGDMLKGVLPYSSHDYARAIIMPNLVPPLKQLSQIIAYKERILAALPCEDRFTPLMTAYLSDDTSADDIVNGYKNGIIHAVKFYPAHATTNSAHGVSSIDTVLPVLEKMQQYGIPLLIHGEVTQSYIDVFEKEARFIDSVLLPLIKKLPELKMVFEHATTVQAADLIIEGPPNLAATVTPQHLFLNRNALFQGGLRPHNYCLPILKKEHHRDKLMKAVTSGCDRFFLGTDSAPHEKSKKQSACGCAGTFNSSVALAIYAQVFEQADALDKLEGFTSLNGPKFYQLPVNTESITLIKKKQIVPEGIMIDGVGEITPLLAGQELDWSIEHSAQI